MSEPSTSDETPDVQPDRSDRGWVWLAALFGGISVFLVLSLGASDPYWRLLDNDPVPAPVYGDPGIDPLASVPRPSPALAAVNRLGATVSEPAVVSLPLAEQLIPLEPQSLIAAQVADVINDAAPALTLAVRAGVDEETDVTIALAPMPISALGALRDTKADELGRISAMVAPEALMQSPLPPHFAGDPTTESALALDRAARVEVQRRLVLAGFDPQGVDGVFGPRTRSAIQQAQDAWGYPPTGYLEPALHIDLAQRTEEAYLTAQRRAGAGSRAPTTAPVARERRIAQVDPDACARDAAGRIIERQSMKCDFRGFKESFGGGGFSSETETTGGRTTIYVER